MVARSVAFPSIVVAPWREAMQVMVMRVAGLGLFEEVGDFRDQGGQIGLGDIPDDLVVYLGVAVYEDVSESDNAGIAGDLSGG